MPATDLLPALMLATALLAPVFGFAAALTNSWAWFAAYAITSAVTVALLLAAHISQH